MKISLRGWLVIGTITAAVAAVALVGNAPWLHAADAPQARPGALSEQSLGDLLSAMGLKPNKVEQRYDFTFKAIINKEEWDLSMTTVLSQDSNSVWVMAWLDELPRSAADVPRTALLRLLSDNDRLGNGKFFAYIASNRRFVLQRVVPNEDMSTASFRGILQDLSMSVVDTYPHWSVANWTGSTAPVESEGAPGMGGNQAPSRRTSAEPIRSAVNDSKFNTGTRR